MGDTKASERRAWLAAYDIRGVVPDNMDEGEAYCIGLAYANVVRPLAPVAVGYDIRLSSPALARAVTAGLNAGGANTREIGLCGTEMTYFACSQPNMGGAIMVTASHNPKQYNGMKLVAWDQRRQCVKALTQGAGLLDIEERVRTRNFITAAHPGHSEFVNIYPAYIDKLLSFVRGVDLEKFERDHGRKLRIVANAGNGGAGITTNWLEPQLPFEFTKVLFEPNGNFPNGVPNPLKNQTSNTMTRQAVLASGADFGIAWDGDYDRCFFFDEKGQFIDGYYVVGLLATQLLKSHPGEKIIHDPRLYWNTDEVVAAAGGTSLRCRTGHARIKEMMVAQNVLYGGEMSAHHYFRDFASCDSGMIPWLLVASLIATTGAKLSELVAPFEKNYPCSGERSFGVSDGDAAFEAVVAHFGQKLADVDRFDGITLNFENWRFNLRESDTEKGQMRLNVEARGGKEDAMARAQEILDVLAPLMSQE